MNESTSEPLTSAHEPHPGLVIGVTIPLVLLGWFTSVSIAAISTCMPVSKHVCQLTNSPVTIIITLIAVLTAGLFTGIPVWVSQRHGYITKTQSFILSIITITFFTAAAWWLSHINLPYLQ